VRSQDGSILIEVETEAVREATQARDELKDLAVLAPCLSAARRAGQDADEALNHILAVQLLVVTMNAIPEMATDRADRAFMLALARRLNYIARFAQANRVDTKRLAKVLHRVTRASAAAMMASRGDSHAAQTLAVQLAQLLQWAVQRDVKWPLL
jgi:hypothetical protein